MALILDTNALSAAAAGESQTFFEVLAGAERLYVPVIVLGEYRFGISLSRSRRDYEAWLEQWLAEVTILDVDDETTLYYAQIGAELRKRGTPIPVNDLWIAALCRQHSLPLMSRDRHFDLVTSLRRIGW